ncbi:MAG: hypothetical protein ABIJ65_13985 [Chloroflexota bacterium]
MLPCDHPFGWNDLCRYPQLEKHTSVKPLHPPGDYTLIKVGGRNSLVTPAADLERPIRIPLDMEGGYLLKWEVQFM